MIFFSAYYVGVLNKLTLFVSNFLDLIFQMAVPWTLFIGSGYRMRCLTYFQERKVSCCLNLCFLVAFVDTVIFVYMINFIKVHFRPCVFKIPKCKLNVKV